MTQGDAQVDSRRRWYTHRFNTDLSWRLILAIMPRVPRWLRPIFHLAFTTFFFLAMGEERRAAGRNLRRVTGRGGTAGLLLSFRLFYNFSKFLVAYTDVPPHASPRGAWSVEGESPGNRGARLVGHQEALRTLRGALGFGRGLILAGMHLGQWDLALIFLARLGVPVTVVMRREDEESARHAAAARSAAGVRVVYPLERPWLGIDLLAALRRGEIVALQADRVYGDRVARVVLFGEATEIPAGPWDLAAASGAPILPGVTVFEGLRRYRIVCGEPVFAEKKSVDARGESQDRRGIERLVAAMEALIRRYPDQWFNFYDVWPREPTPATRAGVAPLSKTVSS